MMRLRSASWRRLLIAGAAASVSGCTTTVDNLGRDQVVDRPVTTVLGPMPCSSANANAYHDILARSPAEIDEKLELMFNQLFGTGKDENIYFITGADTAAIRDVHHNNEVRTEGMGLGMLAAVMLDKQEVFDRLWRYSSKILEIKSGPERGYFKSFCDTNATLMTVSTESCIDPYGMQHMMMALLVARQRWGTAGTTFDYGEEVRRVFDAIRNREYDNLHGNFGDSGSGGQGNVAASVGGSARGGGGAPSTPMDGSTAPSSAGTALGLGTAGSGIPSVAGSAGATSRSTSNGGAASNLAGATNGGVGAAGVSNRSAGGNTGNATGLGGTTAAASSSAWGAAAGRYRHVSGVTNLFDPDTKLVYLDPTSDGERVTATAFEMPGYYSVWAKVTQDSFYEQAAVNARAYLRAVAHPSTGLIPVRATFEAKPIEDWGVFAPEVYRALINLAIDRLWGTGDEWQDPQVTNLLKFFLSQSPNLDDYGGYFTLDGKTISYSHPIELIMANAVLASISNLPDRQKFIGQAWATPIPDGEARYYPAIIYLISNVILGGRFQLCPAD